MTKIALVQMNSKLDWQENKNSLQSLLEKAAAQGARIAFLPECFVSMSNGLTPTPYLMQEDHLQCSIYQDLSKLAQKFEMQLIGGSAATQTTKGIVNRVYNINNQGLLESSYDKRRLFACNINEKSITESDIYIAGDEPTLHSCQDLKIGIGVCFDVRYSEFALEYRLMGANALTFASAFTVPTGKAHWHLLNRARAVESQSFVISSAQWGEHNERIQTYGHSVVIGPWGDVLLDLKEGVDVGVVELDLSTIGKVRNSVLMKREA
jgi:deaminated glutathione amidase